MSEFNQSIIKSCTDSWEQEFIPGKKNKENCSGFVKDVAKKIGVSLPQTADADGIVDEINSKWIKLDSGKEAAQQASYGTFVLAGLRSTDHSPKRAHGHIVVIVDGPLYHQEYPKCWGGSTGGFTCQGDKSVGEVWNQSDRDSVVYYAFNPVCR